MNKATLFTAIACALISVFLVAQAPHNPFLRDLYKRNTAHGKKVAAEATYAKATKVVRVCPVAENHPATYIMQGSDGKLYVSPSTHPTSLGDLTAVGDKVQAKDIC